MAEPARVLAFGAAPAAPRPAETASVLAMPARGRAVMPRIVIAGLRSWARSSDRRS